MIIELLCRFHKTIDKDFLDDLDLQLETESLIKGSNFNKDEEREKALSNVGYEYSPMFFNAKEIWAGNPVDDNHTCIRFYNGSIFTFKIKYNNFLEVYQRTTGNIINTFLEEEKPNELQS